MKLLLDTNAYSALMHGQAKMVWLAKDADEILVSAVVAGELLHGFRKGSRFQENKERLLGFLNQPRVSLVPVTFQTAEYFGNIMTKLRRARTPIPANDVWIAAQAMETGARVASYDKHFKRVEDLDWVYLVDNP